MTLAYLAVLELRVCPTDIRVQKINRSTLLTHDPLLANFLVEDKEGRMHFFQEIFLITNIIISVVLGMPILSLSKLKINFAKEKHN